jgi:hypothetical protein
MLQDAPYSVWFRMQEGEGHGVITCLRASASSPSLRRTPYASMSAKFWPSTPGAPLSLMDGNVSGVFKVTCCRSSVSQRTINLKGGPLESYRVT